jgi:hypothetical protein
MVVSGISLMIKAQFGLELKEAGDTTPKSVSNRLL